MRESLNMTEPAAVILNTSSGVDRSHGSLPELLRQNHIDAKIVIVSKGADITAQARQLLRSGVRTLIAAGGDGTVSSVAAAMAGTGATLGILPLGTLNHFAKDLKLPLDLEGAVRNLKIGAVRAVDLAEVNGRAFVNNSGLGLYPSMVKQREKFRRLGQRKWIAFFHACVATFRRFPFLEVRLLADGEETIARRTPYRVRRKQRVPNGGNRSGVARFTDRWHAVPWSGASPDRTMGPGMVGLSRAARPARQ